MYPTYVHFQQSKFITPTCTILREDGDTPRLETYHIQNVLFSSDNNDRNAVVVTATMMKIIVIIRVS
jgi:hypothetical protein